MRILIWHGYLLGGTGSNVYTRQLAREWSRAGHDVIVFCQEQHPEQHDVGGARVIRSDVGGLLPVFVLDHYEGYRVRLLQDCSRGELDAWIEANAAAVRESLPADFLLCNHVLLGGAVGRATGAPYAVKAHGSELEYSMRGRPELEAWGKEVLAEATTTFTMFTGMAKPMPCEPPEREKIAVLRPTRRPLRSTSAPPELPGLIAASVWMKN